MIALKCLGFLYSAVLRGRGHHQGGPEPDVPVLRQVRLLRTDLKGPHQRAPPHVQLPGVFFL